MATAQSHPGWWTVIPPDSRSLVGIEWVNLRNSPFGEALRAELSTAGSLALPDLPCLMDTHDFLIASPPLLEASNGGCAPATLRAEALAQGLKPSSYRGLDMWTPAAGTGFSMCQLSDRVLLIGSIKSLKAAVDRSLNETRTYSPLLIQGARLARTRDLWVVATELPDALASIFIPLDALNGDVPDGVDVRNFEGGITLRQGLDLGATLDAGSQAGAAQVAESIRRSIPQFPAVAQGLHVAANGSSVTLGLQVPTDALQASLRRPDEEPSVSTPVTLAAPLAPRTSAAPPAPRTSAAPLAAKAPPPGAPGAPTAPRTPTAPPAPKALATPPAPVAPADSAAPEPQIIRIYGLDEGPREIVLPPKRP